MSPNRRLNIIAVGAFSALAIVRPSFAQSGSATEGPQNFETRAQLEAQVKLAEAKQDKPQAYLIHYRLDRGDFHEGDRIVLKVTRGASGFADTLLVRSGKTLQLPQMGELSLAGVLRSELVPKLAAHIGKYLRDPAVEAIPLVRIGILGSVGRPGFYYTSADIPLGDVLMSAGGPSSVADLEKITVRRDGDIIIDEKNTRTALTSGMSMDFLHMQAGDEISVGQQQATPWGLIIPALSTVIGLGLTFYHLHH
jgi:protein involved in polysaccharide export with SLBB domain